jgi:outer membrane protein OmpA-like peptidoglycan-associated protein
MDMAQLFNELGYETLCLLDAEKTKILAALDAMSELLSDGTVSVFYFAGHGFARHGKNYLVPVDAANKSDKLLIGSSIKLEEIVPDLTAKGGNDAVIIVDACRNEITTERTKTRNLTSSLSPFRRPPNNGGAYIVYSVDEGQFASDAPNATNGLFTGIFVRNVDRPQEPIYVTFKRIQNEVFNSSGETQFPWFDDRSQNQYFTLYEKKNERDDKLADYYFLLEGVENNRTSCRRLWDWIAENKTNPVVEDKIREAEERLKACRDERGDTEVAHIFNNLALSASGQVFLQQIDPLWAYASTNAKPGHASEVYSLSKIHFETDEPVTIRQSPTIEGQPAAARKPAEPVRLDKTRLADAGADWIPVIFTTVGGSPPELSAGYLPAGSVRLVDDSSQAALQFQSNSADLAPEVQSRLETLAMLYRDKPHSVDIIAGLTWSGSASFLTDRRLAFYRGVRIENELVRLGVDPSRIQIVRPVVDTAQKEVLDENVMVVVAYEPSIHITPLPGGAFAFNPSDSALAGGVDPITHFEQIQGPLPFALEEGRI